MLRIAPPASAEPDESPDIESPVEDAQEPQPEEASMQQGGSVDKLDQSTVMYKTPDQGPFKCSNCLYFQQPNACDMVDGEIHPDGYCNIFVKIEGVPADLPTDQGVPVEGEAANVAPANGGEY